MDLGEAGYFSKTHGVKGQLVLKQSCNFFEDQVKVLFVDANGSKAPYFISDLKANPHGLIIQLEGLESVEKARELLGKTVYIESRFIEEEDGQDNWTGFEVLDKHFGHLGKVEEVSDNGQQTLLKLMFRGCEIMLPMVDAFIEKIDEADKKIWYNAPEGLIDLYLNPEQ